MTVDAGFAIAAAFGISAASGVSPPRLVMMLITPPTASEP